MGAGASEGALNAANILKPSLARGQLQCIGATTLDEYRSHIEKDPAFARRFQVRGNEGVGRTEALSLLENGEQFERWGKVFAPDIAVNEI